MATLAKKGKMLVYILAMIFVLMSAGIIIAGWLYYLNYKMNYKQEVGKQLTVIGKLKAEGLAHWREERQEDGKAFYKNDSFSALVGRYLEDPNDADARERIKEQLSVTQAAYQYDRVMLLDDQWHKKMIVPDGIESPAIYISEQTAGILQSGKITFEDLYWHEQKGEIYLKVLVPIFEKGGSRMIGAVALRIDPKKYLYPYISNWPVSSITAETQLVRKEGQFAEFLNDLRFQEDTALELKRPLADKSSPAVKAVLGQEGIVDGIDYRGEKVMADIRAVPDSPWFLVTRMDISEIYAPIKQRLWVIVVFVGVLLTGSGTGIGFIWKQRTAGFYRQRYNENKEWSTTFDSIPDLVSVVDSNFRFKIVNKAFTSVFGKQAEEIIGGRCCSLVHGTKEPPENCPLKKTLSSGKSSSVEIYYDGLRKHLEISTFPIFNDKGEVIEAVHIMRDITERKLMEEARKKADVQLRNVSEFSQEVILNAGVGLIVYDTEFKYVEWNTFMEDLTGVKKKDVIGKNAMEVFPHLREQNIDKLLVRALAGEKVTSPDTMYRCPQTGKSGWVVGTYSPHRNSVGQIIGVVGMVRDITERKKTEQTIKNSETKFKTIFDDTRDGMLVADIETRKFQMYNKAICKMLGYSGEEIMRLGVDDIHPEKDLRQVMEVFGAQVREEARLGENMPVRRKDGSVFYADIDASLITLGDKKYIMGSFRDVTERKRAEKHLQAVNALQEGLLPSAPVEQKLKFITDAVVRILDADFARIWVIKPGDRCQAGCVHDQVTEGPHICRFRDRCLHLMASSGRYTHIDGKDHCRVPFGCYKIGLVAAGEQAKFLTNEATSDPRVHNHAWARELGLVSFAGYRLTHTDGTVLGVLALFSKHPISPEEDALLDGIAHSTSMVIHTSQTEDELRRNNESLKITTADAQEMAARVEEANITKREFLAAMSHELRTPLNSVIGFSELLRDELTGEQRKYAEMIYGSGQHLLQVISDILDISEIEAERMDIKSQQCLLRGLITKVESVVRPLAQEKGLELTICEKGSLPAGIFTDPARLEQCLLNLINNAVKFTEQGRICVNISMEDRNGKPFIIFEVEDTGIGIAPEFQEKVFAPFVQEDGSMSRQYGGAGLGLTISKKLAELLGGRITLTSEKGKGSVFVLAMPANVDVEAQQPVLKNEKPSSEMDIDINKAEQKRFCGNILVVENVATNQMFMKAVLEKTGLQVTIAEDGAEGISKALERNFDIIFMDIQMPNVDGYEATRTLRSKGLKTPIIALTAGVLRGDREKCIQAGCDDYMSKPVVYLTLMATISKYLKTAASGSGAGLAGASDSAADI
jgi:PAS domain S-box-containing protein